MKMLEVGILTFQKLFETHPSAKTKFLSFKDMEITDLRGSDMFHNHVSRVMATVKRVRLINFKEKLEENYSFVNVVHHFKQVHELIFYF